MGICPDEELRAEVGANLLPDCRAYETITPPYKEGYPMFALSYSSNGERAILYSLADLAGNPGSGESGVVGAVYADTRTSTGWRLAPLNSPLSQFVGQILVGFEANDGRTLWKQHTPSQSALTRGLYIRSSAGAFSFVGPLDPPGSQETEEASNAMETLEARVDTPVAATSDYKHDVLFAVTPEDYWPFDATEGAAGSLYEYAGLDNQHPTLVGVTGGKGSTQLLGLCGTVLGGGTTYNALSASGETIFFTLVPQGTNGCFAQAPLFSEIYARIHGSVASPAGAQTVNISESRCTEGCGAPSGKNFEGASEDGERVYFTSAQKLVNGAVDGSTSGNAAEGSGCAETGEGAGGCNLYIYDMTAAPAQRLGLVAESGEVLGVMGMAENGSRVYFVSRAAISSSGENEYHVAPEPGQPNLYVYDAVDHDTTFIATLDVEQDAADWQRNFHRPVEVTGEGGRFLLFASAKLDITPDDTASKHQLFEYDAVTGELVRVTKGENGYDEDGNGGSIGASLETIESLTERLARGTDFKSTTNRLTVSDDGKTVFFLTRDQLSPRASSAQKRCTSLYEFHSDGAISQGNVSLVSDGRDVTLYKGVTCGAQLQAVDASGANVLFSTADELLPEDLDGGQRDIYDARVAGGFAPLSGTPSCVPQSSCEQAQQTSGVSLVPGTVGQTAEPGVAPSTEAQVQASSPKRQIEDRAAKLAKALRACQTKSGKRRARCRREARRRYRVHTGSKASKREVGR